MDSADPDVLEVLAIDERGATVRARRAGKTTLTLTALNTLDEIVVVNDWSSPSRTARTARPRGRDKEGL